jgi:hypothetical protein
MTVAYVSGRSIVQTRMRLRTQEIFGEHDLDCMGINCARKARRLDARNPVDSLILEQRSKAISQARGTRDGLPITRQPGRAPVVFGQVVSYRGRYSLAG